MKIEHILAAFAGIVALMFLRQPSDDEQDLPPVEEEEEEPGILPDDTALPDAPYPMPEPANRLKHTSDWIEYGQWVAVTYGDIMALWEPGGYFKKVNLFGGMRNVYTTLKRDKPDVLKAWKWYSAYDTPKLKRSDLIR